jgi:hypothetical protein
MNGLKLALAASFLVSFGACTPGYMRADDLERREQGPSACAKRCEELGMRMGALVLVGDTLPGCVCQPVYKAKAGPKEKPDDAAQEGASAATTSYAVVLAAAAAAQQQQQQQQQRTDSQK